VGWREPFYRESGRTDGSCGHGLGLSIARSVVMAHDGGISARPRPGGGLIVTVVLPYRDPDAPLPPGAVALPGPVPRLGTHLPGAR
jgi:signal transduction histidine kinase